eukprot:TRINITY_DN3730_c0_g3_i3.p1 TRINITY_DN3730_c0_g3~~TRINITY_DN3730_c0_g3_i3.p1  ORF type:complete len:100 (+),score=48.69 TRINITY_DN3730_c0_g3_i3:116-415(+)
MIRRPPRSTQSRSSAASDVYKRQDRHSGDNIMKSFVVAAMLLALTPTPGIASTLGPYDNLPIEELRQIDKDALSKAEKKAYKKALKAAEKAKKLSLIHI